MQIKRPRDLNTMEHIRKYHYSSRINWDTKN